MTMAQKQRNQHRISCQEARGYGKIERIVFGVSESPLTRSVAEALRLRGYQVEFVPGAEEARRRAVGRTDTAVVVSVIPNSSLLSTAKIVTALPTAKVILLAPIEDERAEQFAEFIDASIAFETDRPEKFLRAVLN